MSTPTPRPHGSGAPTPGPRSGVPLPGRHLPGPAAGQEPADPAAVRAEIDALLYELDAGAGTARDGADSVESGTDLARRAHILDQAHEVLVRALATVDKI